MISQSLFASSIHAQTLCMGGGRQLGPGFQLYNFYSYIKLMELATLSMSFTYFRKRTLWSDNY